MFNAIKIRFLKFSKFLKPKAFRKRPITKYIEKGSKVLSTLEPFSIYKLS